jgi:hypothetical protein
MAKYHNLVEEAIALSSDGQYLSAHLTFLQAAQVAKETGDWEERLVSLGNALIAGNRANIRPRAKLSLLLDVRSQMNERPDSIPRNLGVDFKACMAADYFDFLADFRPSRKDLESSLRDIVGHHIADVHYYWSKFHSMRGEFDLASERSELAWATYDSKRDGGSRMHTPVYLLSAFEDFLDAGSLQKASQWLSAARREVDQQPCLNCEANVLSDELLYGLATRETLPVIRKRLRAYESHIGRLQRTDARNFLGIRVELLDPSNGDPAARSHPARQAFCRRLPGDGNSITDRFNRALLHLDIRIAALRFAVGREPEVDLFEPIQKSHRPNMMRSWMSGISTPFNSKQTNVKESNSGVSDRIRRARVVGHYAGRLAKSIDDLLECDWRQNSVGRRIGFIDEIATSMKTRQSIR